MHDAIGRKPNKLFGEIGIFTDFLPSAAASHHVAMEVKTPLGLHDLAAQLGLSIAWLKAEASAGRLPCLRAGRRLLFDRAAVERAIALRASVDSAHGPLPGSLPPHRSAEPEEVARGR